MKVLVLGGTGFIGKTIARRLMEVDGVETTIGARNRQSINGCNFRQIDATNTVSLLDAFSEIDVVVNCITGSGTTIEKNAVAVADAASKTNRSIRIIHMSSMAVYGNRQGMLDEKETLPEDSGWYGKAKANAERAIQRYANGKKTAVMFRIGCVFGAGSTLWVDRIGLLLKSGRLGDLAALADGWSNMVHVEDIAKAVVLSLDAHWNGTKIYNFTAPDSPRWNGYFRDFALAIDSVPFRYKTRASMQIETRLVAPPLKVLERLSRKGWIKPITVQSIPPSLLRLWKQQIRLDSSKVETDLQIDWTNYQDGLSDSVDYFRRRYEC